MRRALVPAAAIGVAGIVVTVATASPRTLVAWIGAFCGAITVGVGALAAIFIAQMTHAKWFALFRPLAYALAWSIPFVALGFVPIAFGMTRVYPEGAGPHEKLWLTPVFFVIRAVAILAVWSALALFANRVRGQGAAAVALVAIFLTTTIAGFDWLMLLQSGFVSTAFGLYVLAGGFAAAIGAIALAAPAALPKDAPPDVHHALGRVLLTGVAFFSYIAFFHLMLIWIGDLPREVQFYVPRLRGSWRVVAILLALTHFAIPLALLLSRALKRRPRSLASVGALVLAAHFVHFWWLAVPAAGGPRIADLGPFLAFAGIAGALVIGTFAPAKSDDLSHALHYESP